MSPGLSGASSFAGGCSTSPCTPTVLQCTTRRDAGARRRLDDVADGRRVDRAIGVRRRGRPAGRSPRCDRRRRRPSIARVERRADRGDRRRRARCRRLARSRPRAPDRAPARDTSCPRAASAAREVAAGESGRAGYEDAHRSATSVTGEPNSLSRPSAIEERPRTPSVKRREPIALCSAIGSTNCRCTERTRKPLRVERVGDLARREKTRYGSVRTPTRMRSAGARPTAAAATLRADG